MKHFINILLWNKYFGDRRFGWTCWNRLDLYDFVLLLFVGWNLGREWKGGRLRLWLLFHLLLKLHFSFGRFVLVLLCHLSFVRFGSLLLCILSIFFVFVFCRFWLRLCSECLLLRMIILLGFVNDHSFKNYYDCICVYQNCFVFHWDFHQSIINKKNLYIRMISKLEWINISDFMFLN